MATVTKDFRVKNGLVVEGTNGTINGSDIITTDAITSGNQTNVIVSYDPQTKQVNFVAENGVADSNTDDLVEGISNLYFTDERAQDAIDSALSGSYGHITVSYDDENNTFTITNDATSANTASTLVERDATGSFSGQDINADGTLSSVGVATFGDNVNVGSDISVAGNSSTLGDSSVSGNSVVGGNHSIVGTLNVDSNSTLLSLDVAEDLSVDGSLVASSIIADSNTNTVSISGTAGVTINTLSKTLSITEAGFLWDSDFVVTSDALQTLKNKVLGEGTELSDNLDAASNKIINLLAPTADQDAATKKYVDDTAISAVSTHNNLTSGVHGVTGNVVGTTDTQTLTNKTLGANTSLAADLNAATFKVSALSDPIADQDAATKAYVDTAVSNLIDAAPGTLDTLNELAQAIGDNPDFITAVNDSIATKVSKAGDSMTGNLDFGGTSKVTSLAAPESDGDAVNKLYTDTEISASETRSTEYTNSEILSVNTRIDELDTDDVAEGAGSLYFTDARAVSALQGTDSGFATIEIDSIAKQVAATASISGTGGPEVVYSFDVSALSSAKFLVKLATATHTQVSEVLVTLDSSNNVALTEYAIVGTNGNIGDVSASFNAGAVELSVTASNPATATVMGTLLV